MLTKRIIPCLDIKNGRTIKGINFENIRDMGDPVELATYYAMQGADELVFLDITATNEKRKTLVELVKRIAQNINIPFTVGGGVSSIDDISALLNAGADKISVNTAAVKNPQLINDMAKIFGSQCIIIAIDTMYLNNDWFVYLNGGTVSTEIRTLDWIQQATQLGAGEILLTSINNDGTKRGFAIELIKSVHSLIGIPVIASGGAGNVQHFVDVFSEGNADAALAAGIFHNKELEIPVLKKFLKTNGINIRI
ncbi:MAG TPA: imidazole glycerol phosphate synthase subunit HisF [Flavipsychrobacter sp.]|nr:imidazole glycerol phosphate synthase subunit HisF [Flavipsychrobacter sp.]